MEGYTVLSWDGWYVLDASTSDESEPDGSFGPSFPDDDALVPGPVQVVSNGAFVETLLGQTEDQRVDFVISRRDEPLELAEQRNKRQFNEVWSEFELNCPEGLSLTTIEGEFQHKLMDRGGRYVVQLYMRRLDEPLTRNGPLEQHHLILWPTNSSRSDQGSL